MLAIRLARAGKHKSPFYRVVLTEHTKPVQAWYKLVLWWFDPLKHTSQMDTQAIKEWIGKWAQPSQRVAKLAYNSTKDEFFKQYIKEATKQRSTKNPKED
jgi:small subunit ribosomal protein S16